MTIFNGTNAEEYFITAYNLWTVYIYLEFKTLTEI